MYLKFAEKVSPRKVAQILMPDMAEDEIEWDYENVYEWAYVTISDLETDLNVSRDHGQSEVDDEVLGGLSREELENLPSCGETYIVGVDKAHRNEWRALDFWIAQYISDQVGVPVLAFEGGWVEGQPETDPLRRFEPSGEVGSSALKDRRRYFLRPWNEVRGDEYDDWGASLWYFETDNRGNVLRQVEVYECGKVLRYDLEHPSDEYGQLSEVALELDEFEPYRISAEEFNDRWVMEEE